MVEINFPSPAVPSQRHLDLANNVEYIYDGVKWDVYVPPTVGDVYWVRDGVNKELLPINGADIVNAVGYSLERVGALP